MKLNLTTDSTDKAKAGPVILLWKGKYPIRFAMLTHGRAVFEVLHGLPSLATEFKSVEEAMQTARMYHLAESDFTVGRA